MIWPTHLQLQQHYFLSFNLFQSFGPCNLTHCKATRLKIWQKVLTVFISRVWRSPMVSLSSSLTKEIPKNIPPTNPKLFQRGKFNSIFRKSAVFCRPLCDKRQIAVEMGQSKAPVLQIWENCSHMRSCQEIQVSAGEEIRSEWEKKSIFRILANPLEWRLQIQRWGRLKLVGMFESEAYFGDVGFFNPLFCKLARCPLVRAGAYFCASSDWNCGVLNSQWREAVIWGARFVEMVQG